MTGVPASSNLRVHPSLTATPPMIPWTACTLDAAQGLFVATPDATSDVSNGMLFLSGPDQYDVVEMDVDGASEKAMDLATSLARFVSGEAQTSIDTPTSYGLPSLRSAGFSADVSLTSSTPSSYGS